MGIAAYNRGSQAIANQIARDFPMRDTAFVTMDRINNLPKKTLPKEEILRGKRKPLLDKYAIQHDATRNCYWMMNPESMHEGFSRIYPTLKDAITSWDDFYLTGYDDSTGIWTAEVITQEKH